MTSEPRQRRNRVNHKANVFRLPSLLGTLALGMPFADYSPHCAIPRPPTSTNDNHSEKAEGPFGYPQEWPNTTACNSSLPNGAERFEVIPRASNCSSLEACPASFSFEPLEGAGARSRLEEDAGALMNSPTVGLGSGTS